MNVLNNRKYAPVGYCIYCGNTEGLTKEHIIPYGLGGRAILPASSCKKCGDITSCLEQTSLRGWLWMARLAMNIQSRKNHTPPPKYFPLDYKKNGQTLTAQLPINQYPVLVTFLKFAVPGYLRGISSAGIEVEGYSTLSFGPTPEQVMKQLEAESLTIGATIDPVSFARMIAKIALAYAAAERWLDCLDGDPVVLPAILKKEGGTDIGQWVGTLNQPIAQTPDRMHILGLVKDEEKGLLIAEVRLFSNFPMPSYGVILGKLRR